MVPRAGFEPAQAICPQRPQRCVSASSTISAFFVFIISYLYGLSIARKVCHLSLHVSPSAGMGNICCLENRQWDKIIGQVKGGERYAGYQMYCEHLQIF